MARAVGLLAAVLLLTGCGVRPTGVVYAGEAPVATAPALPSAPVYLLYEGRPTPVMRRASPWDPQQVFDSLLLGPSAAERSKGLRTDLTGVRQVWVRDLWARDLNNRMIFIDVLPRTATLSPSAYAQLYCTGVMLAGRPIVTVSSVVPAPYAEVQCPRAGVPLPPAQRPPGRS